MPRTDATQAAVDAARNAIVTSQRSYVTTTLPPLHATLVSAVAAMDNQHPTMAMNPIDTRFYRACVQYVNELMAAGLYAGPALRFP